MWTLLLCREKVREVRKSESRSGNLGFLNQSYQLHKPPSTLINHSMKVRIKTKIATAVALFFVAIALITILSMWYLNRLSSDAHAILTDNYDTLTYVESMRKALDEYEHTPSAKNEMIDDFETALQQQEHNITENGEGERAIALRQSFEQFRKDSLPNASTVAEMRQKLLEINALNLQAIVRKNEVANQTADQAMLIISMIGTFILLIIFSAIVNFPGYIANPIARLTEGIRSIAAKNYGERLEFEGDDEFNDVATAFNEMAERLDAYEHSNLAELLFEKRRIEALIAGLQDAVIGLDENQRVLFANPVACTLLGMRAADLLGKYAPDVAVHNDLFRAILQNGATGQPLKIFADGKESHFTQENLAVNVEQNRQTRMAGSVLILRNITPFKELDLAKTNFIATISHELKTPIAAIKMSLKLLGDERIGALNGEQQKLATQMGQESERLLRITGELLDVAQIENGNIRLSLSPTRIPDLVTYATEAVQSILTDKHLRVETHFSDQLPELNIDAEKTAWVLVNLLNNAAKYSPEGERIVVEATRDNGLVVIKVHDFGPGIDEKYQQRLFEKFFQAPTSNRETAKNGSGLGLAISKDFIEAQGGHIWVESSLGSGAQFAFSLPVAS